MEKIKRILVLVDGSDNSKRALEYAAYMAQVSKASVDLLHVVNLGAEIASLTPVTSGYVPDQVAKDLEEAGAMILKEASIGFAVGTRVKAHLEIGVPTDVALEFCEENKIDLIVMGSRGLGFFKGLVLGSVSSYLVEHATCPVLVIK
ncbi:MAG: universal stress protein [Negativicutes bacterium]|nr:universal stress protein [Negativicutes bacterium]